MPRQLTATGTESLRDYVTSNWTQLAAIDDTDTVVAVFDVSGSWTGPASNPVTAEQTVEGGTDVTAGVTLAGTAVYDSAASVSSGDALGDTDPEHEAEFGTGTVTLNDGDAVLLEHDIEIPDTQA